MMWLLALLTVALADVPGTPQDYKAFQDYKEDMEEAGKGATNFTTFSQAWHKYQEFQHYLSKDGSHSPVGFHRFLSDYQQYMDLRDYMGKGVKHQADAGSHFKGFLDFQKFLDYRRGPGAPTMLAEKDEQGSGAASGSGFGGYAGKFVPADTTEGGPKGGLGGVTGDFKHYMDYSKYMDMFHKYTKKDWMSEWQKFQNQSQGQQNVPYNAADCKTVEQLDEWRKKQTDIAKTWIPDMYQAPTLQSIEQDYKTNLERIKHPKKAEAADAQPVVAAAPAAPAVPAVPAAVPQPVVLMQAPAPKQRPSAEGARKAQSVPELVAWRGRMGAMVESLPMEAQSVPELVAWRGRMGAMVESLPMEERAEWDRVLDGEMKAALQRLKVETSTTHLEAKAPRNRMLELSRTMLVFVVSFSVPVAGMYVYKAVKQDSRGTDLDAAFLSLGEP